MSVVEITWDFWMFAEILLIIVLIAGAIVIKKAMGPLREAAILDRIGDWRRDRVLKKAGVSPATREALAKRQLTDPKKAAAAMQKVQESTGTIPPAVVKAKDPGDVEETPCIKKLLEEETERRRAVKVDKEHLQKVGKALRIVVSIPAEGMIDPDAAEAIYRIQQAPGSVVQFDR